MDFYKPSSLSDYQDMLCFDNRKQFCLFLTVITSSLQPIGEHEYCQTGHSRVILNFLTSF